MNPNETMPQDSILLPGMENYLWTGRPSLWSFSGWFFISAILCFLFGFGLFLAIGILIFRNSRRYAVTERKVIADTGVWRHHHVEIPMGELIRVEVALPPLPVAPGIGDLIIQGRNGMIRMDSIYPCAEIRKLILKTADSKGTD